MALICASLDETRLRIGSKIGDFAIEVGHIHAATEVVTRRESIEWFLELPIKIDSKA
jgi:hypothetical protein